MSQGAKHTPLIRRSLLKRIAKGIAVALSAAFLLAMGFAFWALESGQAAEAVRQDLLRELEERCGVQAEFRTVTLDPLKREVQLFDVRMRDSANGEPLMAVEQAHVALRFLPLFYGRYQLKTVALLAPEATIHIADGKVLNLPACLEPSEDAPFSPFALGVNELNVERGRFDLIVDGAFSAQLSDIGISLTPGAGGMNVAVGVDDGVIVTGSHTLPLHRFRLLGHLEGLLVRPRALNVDSVLISLGDVQAELSGSVDLLGPVYEARVKAEFPLPAVHDFVDGLPPLEGMAKLDVAVSGSAASPRAVGQVVLTNAHFGDFAFGERAEVELGADLDALTFSKVKLDVGKGQVTARGMLALDEGLSFEMSAVTKSLPLARVLDAVGLRGSWADLFATGTADLQGTLRPVDLDGDINFDVADFVVFDQGWDSPTINARSWRDVPEAHRMLAIPQLSVRSGWHFDDAGLSFTQAAFSTGATSGGCDARIDFDTGLRVEAQIPSFDWMDLGPVAGLRFGGYGSISGVISGPWSKLGGVGTFELEDITIGGVPFGQGHGNVAWHDLVDIDVTGIEGRLGQSRFDAQVGVRLEGEVPLSISGQIRSGRIEDMLIPFRLDGRDWGDPQGDLVARFELMGPVDRLTGPIDAEFDKVEIVGETATNGRLVGRLDQGRLVAESFELTKHGARIQAYGFLDPNRGDLRLRARTSKASLQDFDVLKANLPRLDGALDFKLSLEGSIHGVTGTVTADLKNVQAGPVRIGDGRISGPVQGMLTHLSGKVGSIALSKAEVGLKSGMPYSATLVLDDIDAVAIAAGLQGHEDYRGRVSLKGDFHGSLIDWPQSSGEILLESGRFQTTDLLLETAGAAKLTLDKGVVSTRRLVISGPRTRVVAEGSLGASRVDLRFSGRVDLGLFELTSPSIEKAGGVLALDAAVAGSPSNLNLVGTGKVQGGLLQLRGFDDRATNFSADLVFSQASVLIERSEGRWAGGKVGITGSLQLERFLPKSLALRIAVEGATPRLEYDFGNLAGEVSGVVNWAGPWTRSQMTGQLDVRKGVVRPKIDWQNLVGSRHLAEVYDPSAEVMDFDVLFRAKDPIRVKNDEADAEVNGEVRLTGTNERFGMLGAVSLVRGGRAILLGREYTMESGVVEFRDRFRFKTRYDLVLSARACAARISLNVVGSLEEVETVYSSNPEMDQRDIVSCLIRGVKVSDLDQDLASFAGSALLKLSGVDREVKKVLPIDQLDVTTEYSSLSRQYEPRVVIGKDLTFLDRPTRLEYSTSLLRSNDQRAALRMRLTPRLNLQFGWTSSEDVPFGDWGLDLRQRWEW